MNQVKFAFLTNERGLKQKISRAIIWAVRQRR